MIPLVCVLLMSAVLALSLAAGINFFWRTGFSRALEPAGLVVAAVLAFWLSGVWEGSSRHSWGLLGPLLLLMLAGAWLALRMTRWIIRRHCEKGGGLTGAHAPHRHGT